MVTWPGWSGGEGGWLGIMQRLYCSEEEQSFSRINAQRQRFSKHTVVDVQPVGWEEAIFLQDNLYKDMLYF